jgi:hypothetical protein
MEADPGLAAFQFTARSTWVEGTAASAKCSAVFDIITNPTAVNVRPVA